MRSYLALFILIVSLFSFSAVHASEPQIDKAKTISFDVFLGEGGPIGHHHYNFEPLSNGGFKVRSRCKFEVKILFFTVYSYNHHTEEIWQNGCLQSMESKTIENGEKTHVQGKLQDGKFHWQVNNNEKQAEDCVGTFAYWAPEYIKNAKKLMNPQTGIIEDVKTYVSDDAKASKDFNLQPQKELIILADDLNIKVWYNKTMGWLGLTSKINGRDLIYIRKEKRENTFENLF